MFVSVDICMTGQLLKMKVLEDLEALYPGVYRHENVLMSATHNHSAAGGFLQVATLTLTLVELINCK